ncbi:MAG: phasin family protein [Rhodospirillales bacterium]|nr:phasin family protein [Rhodospirillales bacterium]
MTKQPFQFDQLAQDAANQSRESMEAFVKSGTIFAKGFEEIIKTAATLTQGAAEKQAEYTKQLMGSKTLNEYAEAQNKIAQSSFDQFMAGATKLSEMSVKVLNEASEPLNEQMTKTMAKANKQMAA